MAKRCTMEIAVSQEGAFTVAPIISVEEARGRAGGFAGGAFGGITQFFSKPKPDDISVEMRKLRYRPVWHASAHIRLAYDRRESYRFAVKTPDHVVSLAIGEAVYPVDGDRKDRGITVTSMAHCLRESHRELWVDAVTGEATQPPRLGIARPEAIELGTFVPDGAEIIEPIVRASAVVRMAVGEDAVPPEADSVSEARADIDNLDLYFLPVYVFTLEWVAKKKSVEVECDGVTGEVSQQKNALHPVLGKLLHKDTLFDLGGETLNLVIPGSAIPLKIVQALAKKERAR